MGGEVRFDGLRVGLQVIDPRVVTLFLRGYGVLLSVVPRAQQNLLDPLQPRFDSAQATGDGVILLRHLRGGRCSRDCCGGRLG